MSEIWTGERLSDNDIYLKEDRFDKPKETHKQILETIKTHYSVEYETALDCGCATGEMIYMISKLYPKMKFEGFDISSDMISFAKSKQNNINFFVENLSTPYATWDYKPKADLVICAGVLQIFDDYELILKNLIQCANSNSLIILHTLVNPDPIDVITRYRRENTTNWETGWNILSKNSIEKSIFSQKSNANIDWYDFEMPFKTEKRLDPMRSWTGFVDEDNRNVLRNGACQLIYLSTAAISIK